MATRKKTAKKSSSRRKAPKPPTEEELDVTDPRRKLSKEERSALTPEQKKERRKLAREARGPAKVQIEKQLNKLDTRLARIVSRFAGSEAHEAGEALIKAMRVLRSDVAELPDDWKPAKASGGTMVARFEKGQTVELKERKRPQYKEILGGEFELKIEKVVGRQVLCRHASVGKLVFRQGDLQAV